MWLIVLIVWRLTFWCFVHKQKYFDFYFGVCGMETTKNNSHRSDL